MSLKWDLDGSEFLSLSTRFQTADMAAGLFGMLNTQFQQLKTQYPGMRDGLAQDPAAAAVQRYADQIVEGAKLSNNGDTLSFVIPQLKDLDKLPAALKPTVDAAKGAHAQFQKKNNLKLIGLAIHNFESTFNHYPALNGLGDKKDSNRGLSWRVYLLPYLDQAPLYQKFNLQEPWDSPTNEALISQMPKVYGSSPEFKSSIHVFTGKGAPFQRDKGLRIGEIKDGTSWTILAVDAGEDTAEIWTKPGGLTFDPNDPLKCLGAAKTEFWVGLFDGSARVLKNIDAATFSKAVQHADGEAFEWPEP